MPALPDAPKVLRFRYDFKIGEDNVAVCREFYQYSGVGPSPADLVTLGATATTSAITNFIPLMTPDRTLVNIIITDLSSPTSPEVETVLNAPGTRVGGQLPASACVLESKHVSRRFRGGHCRTYWPFGADTDLNDPQTWAPAFVTAVTAALNANAIALNTAPPPSIGSLTHVQVSYYHGFTTHTGTTGRVRNVSTPRPSPVIDAVVSFLVQQGIAQIRKRMLGIA